MNNLKKRNYSALEKIDLILLKCEEIQKERNRSDIEFLHPHDYETAEIYKQTLLWNIHTSANIILSDFIQKPIEGHYLIDLMAEFGFVKAISGIREELSIRRFKIAFESYKRLSQINRGIDSRQAFIAMWFDSSMDEAFQAINEALLKCNYSSCRIDKPPYNQHSENITLKIKAEIKRSKFLIAELTGLRGGVYYEAGLAEGLGLKVIYCMKKSEFEKDKPHFDIQQINFILWENPIELKEQIIDRIRGDIDL